MLDPIQPQPPRHETEAAERQARRRQRRKEAGIEDLVIHFIIRQRDNAAARTAICKPVLEDVLLSRRLQA